MDNPLLLIDWYKAGHAQQYPEGTKLVFSNMTPRKSRIAGLNSCVFFGLQYFLKKYLSQFNRLATDRDYLESCLAEYTQYCRESLGVSPDQELIRKTFSYGYLPLAIYALPEGTVVPMGVPMFAVHNTKPEAYWLTNFIETLISATIWLPTTSATTAKRYRHIFDRHASYSSEENVAFQGHDFSFRGMGGVEAATISGAAHLTSFMGSDVVPSMKFLRQYYGAVESAGFSVPATEHSVMCAGGAESEIETFRRIMRTYPTGIVSIVSDTWDYWKVLTEMLPILKQEIMARNGKVVIRPDSSKKTPLEIICGDPDGETEAEKKGSVQLLWETFGGTTNSKGFKVLDPHIGLIYGDSITPDLAESICSNLTGHRFSSTNWVAGIGSYTYQYVTRDTLGMAMKATYVEIDGKPKSIYKDPVTDSGMKKSAKGLLSVIRGEDGNLKLLQEVSWDDFQKNENLLKCVFYNGAVWETNLTQIRKLVAAQKLS